MRRRLPMPAAAALAALLAVAGCAGGGQPGGARGTGGIAIAFDEVEAPETFSLVGAARVAGAAEAPGLWAAVPGLRRPERGLVTPAGATAPAVRVALFRAAAPPVRLSAEAGAALGLAPGAAARVAVTALRREPRIIER